MHFNFNSLLNENLGLGLAILTGVVIVLIARSRSHSQGLKSKYPLPPGPKGSAIIGNLRQVPAERSDMQFAKWAKEFSKLFWDLA